MTTKSGNNYDTRTTATDPTIRGLVFIEKYTLKNKLHRLNGPALIRHFEQGKIRSEHYYINGECHREDGPAITEYHRNGYVEYHGYHQHNAWHRTNGPARIWYVDGRVSSDHFYYIHGQNINLIESLFWLDVSTNKTETLIQLLNEKPELKLALPILLNMLKNDIDPHVFNNLIVFV